MPRKTLIGILLAIAAWLAIVGASPARAQDPGLTGRLLVAINANRIANGLPPYAYNALLSVSAQRHSEYQASIHGWTHSGPDGSLTLQRALAVGYPAIRANENVYSGGTNPEEVANWWYTADQDHRNNILHSVLREIGIGIAPDENGQLYWTMDISAQPNVLPIFINNDAYSTADSNVVLTLWNEGVFYGGGQLGRAVQVMISNSPDFSGAVTQGWAQNIPWTLDTNAGSATKTVYVRFIDATGRTADSQDTIVVDSVVVNLPPIIPTVILPTLVPTNPPPQITQPPVIFQPQASPIPQQTATAIPTQIAEVAQVPPPIQPTQDYSVFRNPNATSPIPNEPLASQILGITVTRLRDIFIGTMAIGVGLITLGLLALIRSWKRSRRLASQPLEEEPSYGDD